MALMKLKNPCLIISHARGDEGDQYYQRKKEYANNLGVNLISVDILIGTHHEVQRGIRKFTVGDIYKCADLVTYSSGYEGFGNAFLEAIYYNKPVVVNRYSIFISDIEPKGFKVITFDGFVTQEVIDQIYEVLTQKDRLKEMIETNYGWDYFVELLERNFLSILGQLKYQIGRIKVP